ncbi:chromosome partitioning protein ParB [Sphingomonas sp. S1-29]|uniref:ParB/RepB/Spo0J family partition protein n=1 Tax=Sphingomonas sp. S1-29 TaxID=2991074 RepID=UPI00223EA27F|nr:chromosome partitioning protein ParB [Sphingomonas sp. S1-29]UZK69776.1 chromosome partitioning protein ParB [Sphingomonas sp. S1-29]
MLRAFPTPPSFPAPDARGRRAGALIENVARRDADEVTQWAAFTRLVKERRSVDDIGATFGLPEATVRRVLALGNLLPRIRAMYGREEIDRATIRHLTLASKRQQQDWLARVDDPDRRAPTGHALKAWLFGGQPIPVAHALFDVAASGLATVTDLFGEDRYFADAKAFWAAQDAAITARREAHLAEGWASVAIVPLAEPFESWEYEKTAKRKGGRVYIDVRHSGEVIVHEGYIARREAERAARARTGPDAKAVRAEITSACQTYVDLHRHAAVRAALTGHAPVALRLMVAHAIIGSPLWTVRCEPQAARDDATRESVETSLGETMFDERRRAVLGLLDMDPERATVTGGNGNDTALVALFLRLLDLPDAALLDVIAIVMGETLQAGSAAVEAVGLTLGVDMARWWAVDAAFLDLVRDKEVFGVMVANVAGKVIANANAGETGKTLKRIIADHLAGAGGRVKVEHWVPRWMAFPPGAYTLRCGVGTVRAYARVVAARADLDGAGAADPAPIDGDRASAPPDPGEADVG